MEDLAVDVVAAAERGEGSGGVDGVGVAVGLIGVPHDAGRLARERCADDQVTER